MLLDAAIAARAPVVPSEDDDKAIRVAPDRLDTPWGSVHFYVTADGGELVAFCKQPGHGDCRLRRNAYEYKGNSSAEAFKGQGRCVPRLCCWLKTKAASPAQHKQVKKTL